MGLEETSLLVLLNGFRRDVERFGQLVTLEIAKLMTIAGEFVEPVGLHLLRLYLLVLGSLHQFQSR